VRLPARDRAGTGPRLPLPRLPFGGYRLGEMKKFLRPILLIAALLFSQHAAMLHGLAHAEQEVALAAQHGGKAPALKHGSDVCAAFGALAYALSNASAVLPASLEQAGAQVTGFDVVPALTRIVFDSRAPPFSA
jgi:hypothetical protein